MVSGITPFIHAPNLLSDQVISDQALSFDSLLVAEHPIQLPLIREDGAGLP